MRGRERREGGIRCKTSNKVTMTAYTSYWLDCGGTSSSWHSTVTGELVQYFVSQLDQWLVLFVSIRMIGDRSVIVIVGVMLGSTVSALFGAVVGAAVISALE